jgi:hypothetical protein
VGAGFLGGKVDLSNAAWWVSPLNWIGECLAWIDVNALNACAINKENRCHCRSR